MSENKRSTRAVAVVLLAGMTALAGCSMSGDVSPSAESTARPVPRENAGTASMTVRPQDVSDARRVEGGGLRYTLAYPTGVRQSSVLTLEADGPEQVRVGQAFSYTVRVTNLTNNPLHGVSVYDMSTDPTPGAARARAMEEHRSAVEDHSSEESRSTPRSGRSQVSTWDVGTLGPKETKTKQIDGIADEVGQLNRCLGVTYTPTLCTSISVVKPELQITKEGPSDVLICQGVTYHYVVTNTGTGTANNVTVDESLPDGLTTAEGAKAVSLRIGDVRQGESKEARVSLRVAHTGRYSSRATARSGELQSQSREVSTAVHEPALIVSVEAPEARYANEPVDYRVSVRNTGDAAAERAVLRLNSPGGDKFADRALGTIDPGATKTVTVSTRAGNQAGDLKLIATAEAVCAKPVSEQGTVAIRTIPALLLECVDSVDPVRVGTNTVYTVTVMNQGSGPDSNVTVKITVPPEEEYVGGNGASAITADGRNLSFAPIATLAPKQIVQWKVEVKGVKAGDARLNADLTSDSLTRPATKSESTRVVDDAANPVK